MLQTDLSCVYSACVRMCVVISKYTFPYGLHSSKFINERGGRIISVYTFAHVHGLFVIYFFKAAG